MENDITDIVERRADTSHEIRIFPENVALSKTIIAAVQGYCIGGGVTLAMLSDLIIASNDATFGNPKFFLVTCQKFRWRYGKCHLIRPGNFSS